MAGGPAVLSLRRIDFGGEGAGFARGLCKGAHAPFAPSRPSGGGGDGSDNPLPRPPPPWPQREGGVALALRLDVSRDEDFPRVFPPPRRRR